MTLITRARGGYLATLGAGLLIGFAVVGTASAGSAVAGHAAAPAAGGRTLAPPVTHHYSLAASALAPDSLGDTAQDYDNGWDPSTLSNSSIDRCFDAGLSLPPNVTLTSVRAYYTQGGNELSFQVNRQNLVHHTYVVLASFVSRSTTGTPFYTSTSRTIKKADAMVNMTTYAYSVGVCPSGTTTFTGLTITYTQPAG